MSKSDLIPTNDAPLTAPELRRREELEATIEKHIVGFTEAGAAMAEMRDSRLYRSTHGTFEDYCRERWGISRSRAHRLMEAADVVANVLPIGNVPANEAQVRPLVPLPPDQQREAWAEAVATAPDGKVTAKHVEAVAKRIAGGDDDALNGETPKQFVDNAPLRALAAATEPEADPDEPAPKMWGGRTIPADAPPLNLDVRNVPDVRWANIIRDIQGCIARLPERETLDELPKAKRKYVAERFEAFARQMQEAVS